MTMSSRQFELSTLLSSNPSWSWKPGMLGVRSAVGFADHLKPEVRICDFRDMESAKSFGSIPDLTDPATIGVLLNHIANDLDGLERWVGRWRFDGYGEDISKLRDLGEICASVLLIKWGVKL